MSDAAPPAAPAATATPAATETPGTISAAPPKPAVKPTPKAPQKPATATAPKPTQRPAEAAQTLLADNEPAAAEGTEGAEPAEAKEPELYEVTINGKKEKWTREKLLAEAQKSAAAQQKFRESAELAKKAQRTLEMLDQDPLAVLAERGIDVDALATERLSRKAEDALLTPEQRELRDLRAQVEANKTRETKAAEAAEAERVKVQTKAVEEHLEKGFIEAAQKAGLPTNPQMLDLMADVAGEFVELGIPATFEQIAAEAKERHEATRAGRDAKVASGLVGDPLLEYLGPKTVEAVLLACRQRLKGAPVFQKPNAAPPPKATERKALSLSEFRQAHGH